MGHESFPFIYPAPIHVCKFTKRVKLAFQNVPTQMWMLWMCNPVALNVYMDAQNKPEQMYSAKLKNNNWSFLHESNLNDTCKFLKRSYSPFPSRPCGHNPEQPMLEALQLEKSSRRHIWPSKDWSQYGTGETMTSPWMRRTFHCCCFHHSAFLPLLPGNALCDKEPKAIPNLFFLSS